MTILDRITEYKREFVASARRSISIETLAERARSAPPVKGFAQAIKGTRGEQGERTPQAAPRLIAEIKRASPSAGIIRSVFDPAELAKSYEAGGASALSVLTDEKFFFGSLMDLVHARRSCELPILRKEFIIDPYQVYEARVAGADCILLISGLEPWPKLLELRDLAGSLGLDVLVEVHRAEEVQPALELAPDLLGINNRDLQSEEMKSDLARTESLIELVPPAKIVISESGIRNQEDVKRLARLGVDGILVGEHLMVEENPGEAIASKLGLGKV